VPSPQSSLKIFVVFLYEIFTAAHPDLVETTFVFDGNHLIARQAGREIVFPRPLPMVKFGHISCGYEEWLARKYTLPGFVWVEDGDVVVDCGAYVGGFSLGAARNASHVHVFEPEQVNFACASENLGSYSNVSLNQLGLYSESKDMKLNISQSSVEHSFLLPDDGPPIATRTVDVVALSDYFARNDIEKPDFVKIEAEGVELEVFAGLGAMLPRKIAIDVSPERNGMSSAGEFRQLLQARNYEVQQRYHVMFARLRQGAENVSR
jgi:FkbM family methyltransferase